MQVSTIVKRVDNTALGWKDIKRNINYNMFYSQQYIKIWPLRLYMTVLTLRGLTSST